MTAGHLRSARLTAGGCGLTLEATTLDPMAIGDPVTEHWHVAPLDNTWSTVASYRVPAGAPPGCYTFYCATNNRAFNPAGWDGRRVVFSGRARLAASKFVELRVEQP